MNIPAEHGQTPKERLQHVAKVSRPFHHELFGPNYLIGIALLMLLLTLVGVGIAAGVLGSDVLGSYARAILELTRR